MEVVRKDYMDYVDELCPESHFSKCWSDDLSGYDNVMEFFKKTILYVEDDDWMINLMSRICDSESSLKLISVHDAEAGMNAAAKICPDAMIVDINLPGMNGFSLIEKLREKKHLRKTPIIVLSSLHGKHAKLKAFKVGADAYLTKPVEVASIMGKIRKIITLHNK